MFKAQGDVQTGPCANIEMWFLMDYHPAFAAACYKYRSLLSPGVLNWTRPGSSPAWRHSGPGRHPAEKQWTSPLLGQVSGYSDVQGLGLGFAAILQHVPLCLVQPTLTPQLLHLSPVKVVSHCKSIDSAIGHV